MRRFLCLLLLIAGLPVAAAERVISLAPSLTDMVLELGAADRLAGLLHMVAQHFPQGRLEQVGRHVPSP